MGWYEQRFTPRKTAIEVSCATCSRPMWLPQSKVSAYKTCGGDCKLALQRLGVVSRRRNCETCGADFTPRQCQISKGGGRYCSQKCNVAFAQAGQSEDTQARRIAAIQEKRSKGEWTVLSGADNPRWNGGAEAAKRRHIDSGKANEQLRRYRKANPDKVREFSRRRAGRKIGRLPYGTIVRIRAEQQNLCAICCVSIAEASHLDHIMPLARGGAHAPNNLQLLCPPCNLRKSDKHPDEFLRDHRGD